jgi:hypothetical protein
MATKKEQCTCPTCELLISDTVANCNSCKKWFHAMCENATDEDLKKKKWFCNDCKNKSCNV